MLLQPLSIHLLHGDLRGSKAYPSPRGAQVVQTPVPVPVQPVVVQMGEIVWRTGAENASVLPQAGALENMSEARSG
jgi:hypothetical protein